ncbi:MAG: hypothetical protein JJE21_01700 [Spirochaetaceae bacterium]|nr:hypothetical protein [Spirochaetaceae bacterium]
MKHNPYSITIGELALSGLNNISNEVISNNHLIYSSPATLSYNAPGAQGFGVKRAGLVLPESIMLLVSPGCCGRNTTILGDSGGYSDRMFHYSMSESDLVTGAHLSAIPQAVKEIIEVCHSKPKVVLICITCVDALLGTDLERVCRKVEKEVEGIHVVPSYMYALLREGKNAPMVAIRNTLYSLVTRDCVDNKQVNLLGQFAPYDDDCEIYDLLKSIGLTNIKEISRCKDFEDYKTLGRANFNLILNGEARMAAIEMEKKLGIPFAELTRLYEIDKIEKQYKLFGAALGVTFDDKKYLSEATSVIKEFTNEFKGTKVAIGKVLNANSFELALALTQYGCKVEAIFCEPSKNDYSYINRISELSSSTKVYPPLSPSMTNYIEESDVVDITIGRDCQYYYPNTLNISWADEIQPFGYKGLIHLLNQISLELRKGARK